MNKLTIIGNLTRDPELRSTTSGHDVCNFTVAVNRRGGNGSDDADFFRVSAWDKLAKVCQNFLAKGRKVCVVGPVSVRTYQASDGSTWAIASTSLMCDKNLFPSPSPLDAPLTKPAISVNSKLVGISLAGLYISFNCVILSSGTLTTPTFGSIVANG